MPSTRVILNICFSLSGSTVLAISELMKTEIPATDADPSSDTEQGQSDTDIYEDATEEEIVKIQTEIKTEIQLEIKAEIKTECDAEPSVNGMNGDVPIPCALLECKTVTVKVEPDSDGDTAIQAAETVVAEGLTS